VTTGHALVLPKRHTPDYFSMTAPERAQADELLRVLSRRLSDEHPDIAGFNVGANSGVAAGQTVFHAHIHLIPRREGDVANPTGGVRSVIPGKADPR
jgi:diadenosine tetraphosphate (Ap4A) HIT family hydrolase